jgi:hypothetical protein
VAPFGALRRCGAGHNIRTAVHPLGREYHDADAEAAMPPNELTPAERAGWVAIETSRRREDLQWSHHGEVAKRIEALAQKLDAAFQNVPEGQPWEPDAALQLEMDELGRLTRDTLARPQKKQVRLRCRQGPNRRPRRETRRRRNVRTRRAKARAPSRLGDDDPEPEPLTSFDLGRLAVVSMRSWAHEQRRLGRRRLAT